MSDRSFQVDDYTSGGVHVVTRMVGEDLNDLEVEIDGELVHVEGYELIRDGGTVRLHTSAGILTFPHHNGSCDRVPKWCGEDVGPLPFAVVLERQRRREQLERIARLESGQ